MKLGAEPKKVMTLGGLLAVAAVVYFINSGDSGGDSGYRPPVATPAATTAPVTAPRQQPAPARANISRRGERTLQEFRPSLKPKKPEEHVDPMTIDPTLRLDVLAKLQQVGVEGTRRSIFDFGQAPAPKPDPVAAKPKPPVPDPLVTKPDAELAKVEPAKPKAPPIPLKFFGYSSPANRPTKRAFFVEGDDVHIVTEGDLVKRRYKIVRIGVNSVVVEDTQFQSEQTLPLEEQPG